MLSEGPKTTQSLCNLMLRNIISFSVIELSYHRSACFSRFPPPTHPAQMNWSLINSFAVSRYQQVHKVWICILASSYLASLTPPDNVLWMAGDHGQVFLLRKWEHMQHHHNCKVSHPPLLLLIDAKGILGYFAVSSRYKFLLGAGNLLGYMCIDLRQYYESHSCKRITGISYVFHTNWLSCPTI